MLPGGAYNPANRMADDVTPPEPRGRKRGPWGPVPGLSAPSPAEVMEGIFQSPVEEAPRRPPPDQTRDAAEALEEALGQPGEPAEPPTKGAEETAGPARPPLVKPLARQASARAARAGGEGARLLTELASVSGSLRSLLASADLRALASLGTKMESLEHRVEAMRETNQTAVADLMRAVRDVQSAQNDMPDLQPVRDMDAALERLSMAVDTLTSKVDRDRLLAADLAERLREMREEIDRGREDTARTLATANKQSIAAFAVVAREVRALIGRHRFLSDEIRALSDRIDAVERNRALMP